MKTTIITGGLGFIGTNLVLSLLKKDRNIIIIDNSSSASKENIKLLAKKNVLILNHDITEVLPHSLTGIDEIYNLACPASPKTYQKKPIKTLKTNFKGTLNMLEIAKKNNAKFLQASTSEIYGDPKQTPQKETYTGNTKTTGRRSCYDEGKRVAETLCYEYQKQYNLNIKIIRIFNTYGPHMSENDGRVIPNMITQALSGENITVYGTGLQTRSFLYIDDLISAIETYMEKQDLFLGPINIGSRKETTIKELAEKIKKIIPETKSKIIYQDLPEDDPKRRNPDTSLAEKTLGFKETTTLEKGLKKTIEYFKDIKNKKTTN